MKRLLLAPLLFLSLAPASHAAARAERVVLVVWDGLRPDSVSETSTPVLFKLSREGVTFSDNHPVYPSSTEVNGTAIATGAYPYHSGVLGNREYRPDIDPAAVTAIESPDAIHKGDELTGGKYLSLPTLEERFQQAGFPTVEAGTKGVIYLHDRADKSADGLSDAARNSILLCQGKTVPASALDAIVAAQGPFPPKITYPNLMQDAWTTQALIGTLWKKEVPKLSVLWLSDPDFTQHESSPGSDASLQSLRSSDHNLGRVLDTLETRGLRDSTDVIVVSDHGFSTVSRTVDVAATLQQRGFSATRRFAPGVAPKPGDIFIAGNGGTVLCYVIGRDPEMTRKLVSFFQQSDYAGVIMTRDPFPGTFPLAWLGLDAPWAADIVVSMRWTSEINHFQVPGGMVTDLGRNPGQGNHTSLSRFDMHNTLIMQGPDFRRGWVDTVASGNVDVAPTVASLFGLPADPAMDGRVLSEALRYDGPTPPELPKVEEQRLDGATPAGGPAWKQYLVLRKVSGVNYIVEGNGASGAAP